MTSPKYDATPVGACSPDYTDYKFADTISRCAEFSLKSYLWKGKEFEKDMVALGADNYKYFGPSSGNLMWTYASIFIPLSYLFFAISYSIAIVTPSISVFYLTSVFFNGKFVSEGGICKFAIAIISTVSVPILSLGIIGFFASIIRPSLSSATAYACVIGEEVTIVFCGAPTLQNMVVGFFFFGPCISPARHIGFLRAWRHISDEICDWLSHVAPNAELVLTGHSQGGALAQIAAYELSRRFGIKGVASFGSAQVGAKTYAEEYRLARDLRGRSLFSCTCHFTYEKDPIPQIPLACWGFQPIGRRFALSANGGVSETTPRSYNQPSMSSIVLSPAYFAKLSFWDLWRHGNSHRRRNYRDSLRIRCIQERADKIIYKTPKFSDSFEVYYDTTTDSALLVLCGIAKKLTMKFSPDGSSICCEDGASTELESFKKIESSAMKMAILIRKSSKEN